MVVSFPASIAPAILAGNDTAWSSQHSFCLADERTKVLTSEAWAFLATMAMLYDDPLIGSPSDAPCRRAVCCWNKASSGTIAI